MPKKCKLIFALDIASQKDFIRWVDVTKDLVEIYKIGLIPFTALGQNSIRILKKRKKKVFLDLKFFDIPNTMIKASLNAIEQGVDILDYHISAGRAPLKQTLEEIKKELRRKNKKLPLTLGITILTSTENNPEIQKAVLNLARTAKDAGLSGVVLSGRDASLIRKKLGGSFKLACPGIRLKKVADDQRRVVTPKDVKGVADFIIVGRPIITA